MLLIASKSKFLLGENPKGWVAWFDWMFKPENFINILEGSYLGNAKKDVKDKSDLDYLERIRKGEEMQKQRDEWKANAVPAPQGLKNIKVSVGLK